MCKKCIEGYTDQNARPKCPVCNGQWRTTPIATWINNIEDPMELVVDTAPVVLLIDISGSMNNPSGPQKDAPTRVELAVHMVKVLLAFCRKLKLKCVLYTFSEVVKKVPVDEKRDPAQAHLIMDAIRPEGQTFLGLALKELHATHGDAGKYFVFTDGEPTDAYEDLFARAQLHLFAFGKGVSTDLLSKVAESPLHSISYIQDIASISGYMVPIFIWAVTDLKAVVLDEHDEQCRQKFVEILEPQVRGSLSQYKKEDLVAMLATMHTPYARDLEIDTTGIPAHGRIFYSFDQNNWDTFGKFYLPCISHSHRHLIPGNSFDVSLKHYRTQEYNEVFDKIASVPMSVEFVAFMTLGVQQRAAAATVVQKSFQYMDTYSYSSSDDGCIGPDAVIHVKYHGKLVPSPMEYVIPGAHLAQGQIKWIIRISNLNHGNPIPLYNGLTGSHPVQLANGIWTKARYYPDAHVTTTTDIVYDVILDDPSVGSMTVNGIDAAVVGYPVPEMVHPYWGSQKVVEDVKARYPEGGFVDVDAKQFKFTNGVVSSLF